MPCPDDGLRFDLSSLAIAEIRPEDAYAGRRARFRAHLGSARIAVQLDIGTGDVVAIEPEEITYPTLLTALPPPHLRAYPREVSVAEKFEAMVRLGTRNSRMTDFHDVWALAGAFAFTGDALQRSIAACFERRGTPWTREVPGVLTDAFYQMSELAARWRSYCATSAVLMPPPAQFEVIGERIMRLLGPVRAGILANETLDRTWVPGGPWVAEARTPR